MWIDTLPSNIRQQSHLLDQGYAPGLDLVIGSEEDLDNARAWFDPGGSENFLADKTAASRADCESTGLIRAMRKGYGTRGKPESRTYIVTRGSLTQSKEPRLEFALALPANPDGLETCPEFVLTSFLPAGYVSNDSALWEGVSQMVRRAYNRMAQNNDFHPDITVPLLKRRFTAADSVSDEHRILLLQGMANAVLQSEIDQTMEQPAYAACSAPGVGSVAEFEWSRRKEGFLNVEYLDALPTNAQSLVMCVRSLASADPAAHHNEKPPPSNDEATRLDAVMKPSSSISPSAGTAITKDGVGAVGNSRKGSFTRTSSPGSASGHDAQGKRMTEVLSYRPRHPEKKKSRGPTWSCFS